MLAAAGAVSNGECMRGSRQGQGVVRCSEVAGFSCDFNGKGKTVGGGLPWSKRNFHTSGNPTQLSTNVTQMGTMRRGVGLGAGLSGESLESELVDRIYECSFVPENWPE